MNQDSESVISVKNLTQRYGTGRVIYSDLSFEVPKGRILGLLGKNGTGKTTTINILMGYLRPQGGECRIFGEKITEITPATRARIALLIEGHVQYAFMTIAQIERFYSKFYPKWNRDAYYELMARVRRDYLRFWLAFLFVANQLIIGFGILLGLGRFGGIFAFSTQFVRFSC